MPRSAALSVENNFTKGLITELSVMNFPEQAATDADNVVFSELGVATRRLGLDYELDYVLNPTAGTTEGVFQEYTWDIQQNDEGLAFLVQQVGDQVWFFDTQDSISGNKKAFFIDLFTYRVAGNTRAQIAGKFCQFTQGKGYLFVVHPLCEPLSISYDIDADTIDIEEIVIQIRDFEHLEDNLDIDERPATLSNLHKYNLYNQGWYTTGPWRSTSAGPVTVSNVLVGWDTSRSDFPSNADIWWVFKDSTDAAVFSATSVLGGGVEAQNLGNTPAPNGHYIYNAWDVNRTTKTGITGLPSMTAGRARPSTAAFYAGRIFYAGIGADKYSDKIYFTQIIESPDQFGKCYQINDPTSEQSFDLLDTDGGVISIPGLSKIISLRIVGDALIILGTTGVYAVRGTDNGSFKATDYSIEYLSSVGAVSHTSVIEVDGTLMWWNLDALYALAKDQAGLGFQIQNASKMTIQSLLDDIPTENKEFVKGAFNRKDQLVYWLFSDVEGVTLSYNRILVLNILTKGFYPFTIDTSLGPKIVGIVPLLGKGQVLSEVAVTISSGETVETIGAETVTTEEATPLPRSELFVFTTYGQLNSAGGVIDASNYLTYSNMAEGNHIDWPQFNGGVDATSYFVTGYRTKGEFIRKFQTVPMSVVLGWGDNFQVSVKGIWDYGERQSSTQSLYPLLHNSDYLIRRIKIRGKGRAMQLRFDSSGSDHFEIYGWSILDTGGQVP